MEDCKREAILVTKITSVRTSQEQAKRSKSGGSFRLTNTCGNGGQVCDL